MISAEIPNYPSIKSAVVGGREVNTRQRDALRALGEGLSQSTQKTIAEFFVPCVIQAMTTKAALSDEKLFPAYRKLLSVGLAKARDTQTKNYLLALFNSHLSQIVATKDGQPTNYSPAARYNALLALGDLDDREFRKSGANYLLPVPNEKARKFIISYLNANKPDAVYVAGLIGLKRHLAILMADPDQRTAAADDLKAIATIVIQLASNKNSDGLTNDGHTWVRILALECIELTKSGSFGELVATIAGDETEPLVLRCAAASALGKLSLDPNSIDVKKIVADLEQMAHLVCMKEVARVNKAMKPGSGGGFRRSGEGFGRGSGGLFEEGGGTKNDEQPVDPLVQEMRRQLLSQLKCIRLGATNKSLRKSPEAETLLKDADSKFEQIWNLLKDDAKTMTPEDLVARIESMAKGLEPTS